MTDLSGFPEHLQTRLRGELKAGESVVWAGQPIPNRYMRSAFLLWFFFIPWTAFALFWMAGASGFKFPDFKNGWSWFPFFGLPFVLIGFGGLSSPFWARHKARSMIYAITNQRAIIIQGLRSITVNSYPAIDIDHLERTEHSDGSGDLILRKESYRDSDGDRAVKRVGFFAIDNVREVEDLVEKLVERHRA